MAVVVIFGLGFATILTLVVVPSLYVMLTRLALRVRAALRWGEDDHRVPDAAITETG